MNNFNTDTYRFFNILVINKQLETFKQCRDFNEYLFLFHELTDGIYNEYSMDVKNVKFNEIKDFLQEGINITDNNQDNI